MIFDDPSVIIEFAGYLVGAYGFGWGSGYFFHTVKRVFESL